MRVTVAASGTGGGFEKFCVGETDISDASRPIKDDEEVPVCEENGVEFTELEVGTDALTVVVHPRPRRRLPHDRAARRAVGAELQDHQLEPARPELPRPGGLALRARLGLGHLQLHGRGRHRRRVRDHPRGLRVLGGRQRPGP
ncbi:substrate-binding domain-containing protein [Nocardioides sp. B-3]|uniref:substrate-binding domain-containing protein n=1 Tax=Nocardioides sp. B-3 TaxID=2895565 RepID=UPI002152CB4E|nr:substrate-binding domain-containing protein [Nocardioides sp. B-3]UUZ57614.1 substrate-binding domain-containing protein [Nocardioides sp. B-3]